MQPKLKIKKDDEVVVLTGKDKGKKGTVVKVFPKESRLIVSGINMMKKHERAGREGPGGITLKEAPIHISNVAIADPKGGKATRVGFKILKDGTKARVAKGSGEVLN